MFITLLFTKTDDEMDVLRLEFFLIYARYLFVIYYENIKICALSNFFS